MTTNEWEGLAAALTESWKRDFVERTVEGETAVVPESTVEPGKREPGEPAISGQIAAAPEAAALQRRDPWEERTAAPQTAAVPDAAAEVVRRDPVEQRADRSSASVQESTVESLVRSVVTTQTASQARRSENVRPSTAAQTSRANSGGSGSSGSSIASEVLKTAAMVTGIGPLATGLMKLFGGGSDDKPAAPPLVRYDLPSPVQVDAGLMPNRALTQVSYAQNDQVRGDTNTAPANQAASPAAMPAIQIQVNAMDSRSFLDHRDEIAQAVRPAMLRSHALNDVVSEI